MTRTVKLMGVYGRTDAKPAEEMQVGDIVLWNYGVKGVVLNIVPSASGKTYDITTKTLDTGYISTRRYGAKRLIGVEL